MPDFHVNKTWVPAYGDRMGSIEPKNFGRMHMEPTI